MIISLLTFWRLAKLSDSFGDSSNKIWKRFTAEENYEDNGDNDDFI